MKVLATMLALAIGLASTTAMSHTTSLGYVPGAVAGSVIIWAGHYDHHNGAVSLEGTGTLTGISLVYSQIKDFSIGPVTVKPVGLIDGTNNFYWSASSPHTFPESVDPLINGGVVEWQGVSFSGLAAGTYNYTCGTTCGTSNEWASYPGTAGTVSFTLKAADINPGVPEPATWALMITGLGMVGVSMRRRARGSVTA